MNSRLAGATLLLAAASLHARAHAADFDDRGAFSFATGAVFTESFEEFAPIEAGTSSAFSGDSAAALHGSKVLRAKLQSTGLGIPVTLPPGRKSYQLSFWIQGDCVGGLAADYGDGRPGVFAQAFPTGRITSDGWVEMQTAALPIDGEGVDLDARVFLSAYDAYAPLTVDVDAVEVTATGKASATTSCTGLDLEGACSDDEMCLGGTCHPAEGWFPPLPSEADRHRLVDYWNQKIRHTYAPYLPRKLAMPEALHVLEEARYATSAVKFWNRFAETIRRLRDAHTYTRSPLLSRLQLGPAMNVCFFEGSGDRSHDVWPSDPTYRDILVSHVGPSHTWGMNQGDRLVAIDGVHPLAWARALMARSLWYWESDEPLQFANVVNLIQRLIPLHATTLTVVHCSASTQSCDAEPTVIRVDSMEIPSEKVKLVGCDNRPFYHLPDAPEDHLFGDSWLDEDIVLEGWLAQSSPEEGLRGLVWNSLLGGWPGSELDKTLRNATYTWTELARGVVLDHREGHGGTAETGNILVGFSRERFVPMVSLKRDRANDEGPQTPAEGVALFEKMKYFTGQNAGSNNPQTHIPVALLLTWDVSASDFLPYMLKGAPRARLFGPGPTMGAFGTFFQYSYWGGLRWSLGAEDSLSTDGLTLCGRGVYPDEIVVPKQSDLLEGKDTIHEAALSWLRTEIAP